MLFSNHAEGGSNGVTPTTANSGGLSGRAWNNVNPDVATFTYSTNQSAHGTLSYWINQGVVAGPYVAWDTVTSKTYYSRIYLYFNSSPPTVNRFMQFTNASVAMIAGVGISSGDLFTIKDSANATVATSTTSLPIDSWFRLEFSVFSSLTVGWVELKIFLSPDSTSPDEVITTAATQNTRGDDIAAVFFGLPTSIASADFYMDDIGASDTGYIGPVIPSPPTVTTSAVTAVGATTATGNGNVISAGDRSITERGVCWSTSENPTIADSKATAAGTTGTFNASLTSLSGGTRYYVRAYTTSTAGTTYGSQVTFIHNPQSISWTSA